MKRRYTVVLLPDQEEGGYDVVMPALPGCVTQADTLDQALERAQEVIELYLTDAQDRKEYIPVETAPPTILSVEVEIPAEVASAP